MSKLTRLPIWQQYALGFLMILPWISLAVFTSDAPRELLHFQNWPETLRTVAIALFGFFMVADAIFAIW